MRQDNFKRYNQAEAVPTSQVLQHPTKPGLFYPVHRRPVRLRHVDYATADCLCFVTFNVNGPMGVLLTEENAPIAWAALREQIRQTGCTVHAGCMMPDHVHLLMAPSGAGESLSDIVRRMKSCICLALRTERSQYLKWQSSFYDHLLRPSETAADDVFHAIVHYIRTNPQRAGLPDNYPYIL